MRVFMCYRELFCAGWQLLERFKIEVKIQDLLCVTLILDMITWVKTTRMRLRVCT